MPLPKEGADHQGAVARRAQRCVPAVRPIAAAGTLLGCLPNNFVAVNAGSHLGDLRSLSDLYDPKLLAVGLVVGAIALAPVYLRRRHEQQPAAQAAPGAPAVAGG